MPHDKIKELLLQGRLFAITLYQYIQKNYIQYSIFPGNILHLHQNQKVFRFLGGLLHTLNLTLFLLVLNIYTDKPQNQRDFQREK